jgi:transcriptional regulator with XRE-family HTH domain
MCKFADFSRTNDDQVVCAKSTQQHTTLTAIPMAIPVPLRCSLELIYRLSFSLKIVAKVRIKIASRCTGRRLSLNMPQRELALRSGVSCSSLKRFEREGLISLHSLRSLAMVGYLDDFDSLPQRATRVECLKRSMNCWRRRKLVAERQESKDALRIHRPTELLIRRLDAHSSP